ncbi:MAG: chloride channel protein [Planctomycetota bacterium]|nr:MAG: chloride channel protein [Planctomycetota bacterium]
MSRDQSIHPRAAAFEIWWMVILANLVGVASAGLAVALRRGVHALAELLTPWRAATGGILLPAAGALAGVLIVRVFFREPGGHGVPAVLEAVSRRGGAMRRRSILSRLLGSLLTVASGGSAGLEGPTVFSAAAVGSRIAAALNLAERQRVRLLACGVAGGIGAIFGAPLTGMIFAMEVVLAEWTLGAVIPVAVSSVVATEIGRVVLGEAGAFSAGDLVWDAADLAASLPLGLLCGLVSVGLVVAVFRVEQLAERARRRSPILARPGLVAALAGLGVGLVGWRLPEAIGEGYELVDGLLGGHLPSASLLLFLLVGKLLATALTLGSNAPGGIFAPSLVLGALLGSSFGTGIAGLLPGIGFAPPPFFALAAMAGLVAGAMQAPFTGLFLALETTGGWNQTLPLMMVATLSALVSRTLLRHSFYTWEVAESGRLLRPGTDRRILAELTVGEMLDEETATVPAGSTLEDLTRLLPRTRRNHFAVLDPDGCFEGMLDISRLRPFIFDETLRRATPVDTVMDRIEPLRPEQTLLEALGRFDQDGAWVLPVAAADRTFLGTVSKSTLFDRYRSELIVQTADRAE